MCSGGNELRHALATANWDPRRAHNPPAIGGRDNILSEEPLQSGHVCLLRGSDKGVKKAPLLARTDGCASAIGDVFTRTGDELADVCFLHLQDVRDLTVGVIECFAQNI